ncbi:hypothetical protein BO221_01230 [Archangium sp. Cb G35]|nr:hypothetical protein BO221_01230 [Archangium sp. Cb G35]
MPRESIRSPLGALLSGLLLTACGGGLEAGEAMSTQEAALDCAGASASINTQGYSSYGGVFSGGGAWSVNYPSNSVVLEYFIDGVKRGGPQGILGDSNRSGSWNFNDGPVSCGSHTFMVKAYPAVYDSTTNNFAWCTATGVSSTSGTFTQACPTASLTCSRSGAYVTCTGSGSGGSGSPTPFWQARIQYAGSNTIVPQGWLQGTFSRSYYCPQPTSGLKSMGLPSSDESVSAMIVFEDDQLIVDFKVRDSSGMESPIRSSYRYACGS